MTDTNFIQGVHGPLMQVFLTEWAWTIADRKLLPTLVDLALSSDAQEHMSSMLTVLQVRFLST